MDESSKEFSYMDGEKKIGPVELKEIKSKVEQGLLEKDVLIHQKGKRYWVTYKQYMKMVAGEKRRTQCVEGESTLSAVNACYNCAILILAACFIYSLISSYFLVFVAGVFLSLLVFLSGKVIKYLSIDDENRNQRIIDAINKLDHEKNRVSKEEVE